MLIQVVAGRDPLVGLGQLRHAAIGRRTGGRGGHHPFAVRPRIEDVEQLLRLDGPHRVARAAGIFVVLLDDQIAAVLILALQQRREASDRPFLPDAPGRNTSSSVGRKSTAETMCTSSMAPGWVTPGQRKINGVCVLWW